MTTDLADFIDGVPGRFVPDAMRGQLVEAEHMTRYLWAASFAAGKRVLDAGSGTGYGTALLAASGASSATGIDVAEDVVAVAAASAPAGARFDVGDVRTLPYPDDSFDLVTCFEVIEHISEQEAAFAELARVLTPTGLLLVSSPNREVYVPGNPHHVHELVPEELERLLHEHWAHTRLMQQHNYVASAILDATVAAVPDAPVADGTSIRRLVTTPSGEEVYTLGMASEHSLPDPPSLVTLASSVEVREWLERFETQQRALHELSNRLEEATRKDGDRIAALKRLAEAEQAIARLESDMARLRERLARSEDERSNLEQRVQRGDATVHEIVRSPSWRITAPLRAAKRLVRRG